VAAVDVAEKSNGGRRVLYSAVQYRTGSGETPHAFTAGTRARYNVSLCKDCMKMRQREDGEAEKYIAAYTGKRG
jgi:hypothetical protein